MFVFDRPNGWIWIPFLFCRRLESVKRWHDERPIDEIFNKRTFVVDNLGSFGMAEIQMIAKLSISLALAIATGEEKSQTST